MEFRSPVVLGAAPAGLALACIGWLLLGGSARVVAPLDRMQARLDAAPAGRTQAATLSAAAASAALSIPLFAAGAAEPSVRLDGLSRTQRRAAALLSINGGPPQWLVQGGTREGVTLVQVLSTKVVIDSRSGRRAVALGETSGSASDLAGDQPPPGTHMPPPPASAPVAP